MKYKLNLSKEAEKNLRSINNNFSLTPNIICRYAVLFSLKNDDPLKLGSDNKGVEFQRYTLTGEYDLLFRELIKSKEKVFISDDEYFGTYLKSHIERGLVLLQDEILLAGSFESLIYELIARGGTI